MHGLDWDAFRVLLAVVERGSFSAGARALGISQPTAGRKIAELEGALGARLLVRRSRGVLPTPAGEEILAEARRMAEGARAALRRASGGAGALEGLVRISASEGLGAVWLPPRLAAIREEHSGIRVELVIDNAAVDLAARQADIAIRLFRPTQPDLVARKVAALGFGFFAAPSYLAARGAPRRLSELACHDFVGLAARGGITPSYVRWLDRLVPPERFVVTSTSLLAQHEAARAGLGLVLGTAAILTGDPRLRRVLPRARPPSLDVWLAVHADVRRSPVVGRMVEALADIFGREARALAG